MVGQIAETLRSVPLSTYAVGALAAIALAAAGSEAIAAIAFAAENLMVMAPVIVIAGMLAGWLIASGSSGLIAAAFRGRPLRMIAAASFIGALTPVCGISVLPLVAALLAAGVPLAPIMAFWLSSPITDPAMLAVTAATLGVPFAIGKTLGAFGIGVFGGAATLALARRGYLLAPMRERIRFLPEAACGCAAGDGVRLAFWREAERRRIFSASLRSTISFALAVLSIAFVAEYFLRAYLPPDLLARHVGDGALWAVPGAALVGAPIYLDGYAALPLVRGLTEAGMGSGPAMAFLVAGGIISAWGAIPVYALVRLPVFVLYLVLALSGSMLAGWAFGWAVS